MSAGINPKKLREYVLKEDRELPEDRRPVFLLRPLTMFDRIEMSETYENDEKRLPRKMAHMVQLVLSGWRNFKDSDGEPLEFDPENPRAAVSCLRLDQMVELFNEVMQAESVTTEDAEK